MIGPLLVNEWRAFARDRRGWFVFLLGALLAGGSAWTAASTDHRARLGQAEATAGARDAWLEREADNPHSRAHYGDYVFRPSGPLAGLDSGLQMVTGRAVRLEAHGQNAAIHRPYRDASSLLRFERLEPSTVLNLLVPLILILMGFGVVASERESGRLKLLRLQGAGPLSLLLAKSLALWSVGAVLTGLVVVTHLVVADSSAALGQTAIYFVLHLLVLWIVSVLVACVSSWSRRPGTAATVLLSLWVAGAILLPRLAAMTADAAFPLPSRDAFEAAMREDREQGLDGHNPADSRRLELEQKVLAEYGVSSKEELPVNLDGLIMQADEDYGDRVWDEHYGELEGQLRRQSAFVGLFSFANPLQAVDRVSMSVAGTDLNNHFEFLAQVEAYRRMFVKALNDQHAYGGSRTGDWSWTADREFYAAFKSFRYEPPPLRVALAGCSVELSALALWGVFLTGLLFYSARRLEHGGSL